MINDLNILQIFSLLCLPNWNGYALLLLIFVCVWKNIKKKKIDEIFYNLYSNQKSVYFRFSIAVNKENFR